MNNNRQQAQQVGPLSVESSSVQSHLQIMQSVIQRMGTNSIFCKTWCITIVSAILVLIADKNRPDFALVALAHTVLFFILDAHYLALEKAFRQSYDDFISKLHKNQLSTEDLYSVLTKGKISHHQFEAVKSFTIWAFYSALVAVIFLTYGVVLK